MLFLTKETILLPYYQLLSGLFQSNLLAGICVTISVLLLWIIMTNILLLVVMASGWLSFEIIDKLFGKEPV